MEGRSRPEREGETVLWMRQEFPLAVGNPEFEQSFKLFWGFDPLGDDCRPVAAGDGAHGSEDLLTETVSWEILGQTTVKLEKLRTDGNQGGEVSKSGSVVIDCNGGTQLSILGQGPSEYLLVRKGNRFGEFQDETFRGQSGLRHNLRQGLGTEFFASQGSR
jgi:hypothetical protein